MYSGFGSLEVFQSSLAYRITFPDSGQNRKKVIYEGTRRSKIQRVRTQSWTCVVFSCKAFVLVPVKQEILERTICLKERQQHV